MQLVTYNQDKKLDSKIKITTQGGVAIPAGVKVEYIALQIVLGTGFHARAGSTFTAKAMNINCSAGRY